MYTYVVFLDDECKWWINVMFQFCSHNVNYEFVAYCNMLAHNT
jgi:hypothetical protein